MLKDLERAAGKQTALKEPSAIFTTPVMRVGMWVLSSFFWSTLQCPLMLCGCPLFQTGKSEIERRASPGDAFFPTSVGTIGSAELCGPSNNVGV